MHCGRTRRTDMADEPRNDVDRPEPQGKDEHHPPLEQPAGERGGGNANERDDVIADEEIDDRFQATDN
jgi:hypothetical protein